MATIDVVASDKRAADIIDKYRARLVDLGQAMSAAPSTDAEARALATELQSDIANAINAAVSEAMAREPAPLPTVPEDDGDRSQEMSGRTRNATHMPATGHHRGK